MPLYDYQCQSCQHVFEELMSMNAPSPSCPLCSQETQRLIASPYIVRDVTLFARRRVPQDFKEGVLGRLKSQYPSAKQHFRD